MKNNYDTEDSVYCYPGTATLKNKLNITNEKTLERKEHELVAIRNAQLITSPLYNKMSFSIRYLQELHRLLFQDVYAWAGKFRTVRMSKNNFSFAYPEYIQQELERHFNEGAKHNYFTGLNKNEISHQLAEFKTEINSIHPFREGNGRTIRKLIEDIAHQAGYNLRFRTLITRSEYLQAMILSPWNSKPIEELIRQNIKLL